MSKYKHWARLHTIQATDKRLKRAGAYLYVPRGSVHYDSYFLWFTFSHYKKSSCKLSLNWLAHITLQLGSSIIIKCFPISDIVIVEFISKTTFHVTTTSTHFIWESVFVVCCHILPAWHNHPQRHTCYLRYWALIWSPLKRKKYKILYPYGDNQ